MIATDVDEEAEVQATMSALATSPARRLRFSLRALAIVITLTSVFLGWLVFEVRRAREIDEAIQELELVQFTCTSPVPSRFRKYCGEYFLATIKGGSGGANADANLSLKHLQRLEIEKLYLGKKSISDSDLEHLRGVTSLTTLMLSQTQITDAGLEQLGGLNHLEYLSLDKTAITDAGLRHMRRLKGLKSLCLAETKISDAGLRPLLGLTNLTQLNLTGTKISDAGLGILKEMVKLDCLTLDGTEITDDGLKHLEELASLAALSLCRTNISDAGLKHLRELPELTILWLTETKITDAGLVHLKGLTKLQHVDLGHTAVTVDGVQQLQQALPTCLIVHDSSPGYPFADDWSGLYLPIDFSRRSTSWCGGLSGASSNSAKRPASARRLKP